MKKIFNLILLAGTAATLLFSCRPMDLDVHQLGAAPSEDQLSFSCAPSADTPNILELTNTSSVKGVALWDLGNGATAKGDKVSATYPFKGEYTVTMSLYTTGGFATVSQVVTVDSDDYGLLDTPGFNALTGGCFCLGMSLRIKIMTRFSALPILPKLFRFLLLTPLTGIC